MQVRRWVRRLGTVAGGAAVVALLMLAARGVHWPDVWRLARAADPVWLALAVALNCAVLLLWSAAWQRFLLPAGRPPLRRVVDVVATGAMLMNTAPLGVGHATAFVLLTRRAGASAGSAARVLALDQLAEGAAKLALVLLAALLVPLPGWLRGAVVAAAGVVIVLGVGVWIVRQLPAASGELPVQTGYWRLITGDGRGAAIGLLLIFGVKAAEVGATLAVQRALGVELPVGAAVLSLAAVQLATALPITPGSVGQYEAAAMLAYRHLGVSAEAALGLAVVQHLCLLLPLVGTGAVLVLARGVISATRPAGAGEAAG